MKDIELFLTRLQGLDVMVVGDLILDEYLWCQVHRISPEAPVPVCRIQESSYRLGGAANVGCNIQSLGGVPHLVGCLGNDVGGDHLVSLLQESDILADAITRSDSRLTTQKSRVIAKQHHVVRLDREEQGAVTSDIELDMMRSLSEYESRVKSIVISDYGKGVVTPTFAKDMIDRKSVV